MAKLLMHHGMPEADAHKYAPLVLMAIQPIVSALQPLAQFIVRIKDAK